MADLTVEAVCAIIDKCKFSGVSALEYQGLRLQFHPPALGQANPEQEPRQGLGIKNSPDSAESGSVAPSETPKSLMMPFDEAALEEARISQLMIDDPEAYESMMIDASLNRERARVASQDQDGSGGTQ